MTNQCPVIIIGAGIGGLATAACLSKMDVPSLLLEKTGFSGGRCSTRVLNGNAYEIGAIYVGGGVFDRLRNFFGLNLSSVPVKCGIKIGKGMVSFPFGLKTLFQLRSCGVSVIELLRMQYRSKTLADLETFETYTSMGSVADSLTNDITLRKILHTTAGLSGTSPYRLPSTYMYPKNPVACYKTLNPEYLASGNGGIAEELLKVTKKCGEIMFNTEVKHIVVSNGVACAVETEKGIHEGRFIVSDTGLKDTVLRLTDPSAWPVEYCDEVSGLGDTLQVVTIFLTLSGSFALPKAHTAFLMPYELNEEFRLLDAGFFPLDSMFILHVPSNIEAHKGKNHRATLQFYYPRQAVSKDLLERQTERVVRHGLNNLFPGLADAVIDCIVCDPFRYKEEFGFMPSVFGVSPDFRHRRLPISSPVNNLFLVGDSVGPDGPCVAQAFESGLECAGRIIKQLTG